MPERILVTGGSGRLAAQVIADLVARGDEVMAIDRVLPNVPLPDRVQFAQVDLADVGGVTWAMRGCDAVIHLGAIPSPWRHPDQTVFLNNVSGTFAVLQAAGTHGITRIALASSASIYGTAWSPRHLVPLYAPMDEAHPLLNHDPYGLSKEVDERIAAMHARQYGMSIACMRFHLIADTPGITSRLVRFSDTDAARASARGFWGYVDRRDAARSLLLAIDVARTQPFGFLPLNIIGKDTLLDHPTEDAIRALCPDTEIRAPIPGFASAYDCSRARETIGWEPAFSWRDGN